MNILLIFSVVVAATGDVSILQIPFNSRLGGYTMFKLVCITYLTLRIAGYSRRLKSERICSILRERLVAKFGMVEFITKCGVRFRF